MALRGDTNLFLIFFYCHLIFEYTDFSALINRDFLAQVLQCGTKDPMTICSESRLEQPKLDLHVDVP